LLGSFPHEGQSHIGTLANNTLEYKLYTEGDVFDSAPSWDISNPDLIYYQSSGVGRNQDGYIFGIGPSSIHSLNLETSDQEVVFEDELYDFLIPKPDSKSNLYYLKRPYEQQELNVPWYKALLDIILIPFYFIKGIINIVDGLSKIFSSNKQILHAGPQQPQNNNLNRWITLKGANIDLHKLKRTKDNDGSVVPKSWQLLCRQANGEVVLVADSVLDFDVSADGDVICTNGYKVFQIKEGKKKQLHKTTSIIEQVRWVTLPKNSR